MSAASASAWFFRYFMFTFWSVIYGTFIVVLVVNTAPYASGSGIPEIKTILSGFIMYGYLGKWTFLIKSLGMIFATSAGLIVGKEGPFVHISCCCGNLFSSKTTSILFFCLKKKEFVSLNRIISQIWK